MMLKTNVIFKYNMDSMSNMADVLLQAGTALPPRAHMFTLDCPFLIAPSGFL